MNDDLEKASPRSDIQFNVYRPLVDKSRQGVRFKQGSTLLGERNEVIYSRNEIFQRIFDGKRIKNTHMFSSIKKFTPTGKKLGEAHNSVNVNKYNNYVRKRQYKELLYKQHLQQVKKSADKTCAESLHHYLYNSI